MADGEAVRGVNLQASVLTKFFALKSVNNHKYMRFESEEDSVRKGFARFTAANIAQEPRAKFEVEPASTGKGLVHIRCCFNNKYLRRWDINHDWIVVGADKKEEDRTRWSCTLFEPVLVTPADVDTDKRAVIRLRHVQLGLYLMQFTPSEDFKECLYAMSDQPYNGDYDLFEVLDWSSLVVLPKYVAFKAPGDKGKYVKTSRKDGLVPKFTSSDVGEEGVAMEIEPFADGYVRIKGFKHSNERYWGYLSLGIPLIPAGILFQIGTVGTGTILDLYTAFFLPVKVEENVIALKDYMTHMFCRRITPPNNLGNSDFDEAIIPDTSSITEEAKLEMHEAVMKRTLSINFRLDDARAYDLIPISLDRFTHDNHDDHDISKTVTLTYKNDHTTSWEASNTWTAGVKTSIEVDVIPFISKASVELSASYGESYTWGKTETKGHEISESDVYTVRGKHKLTVSKLATKGHCDVPYSYVQTDYLFTGEIITTEKYDGIFKGVNYFDIHTESNQTPL